MGKLPLAFSVLSIAGLAACSSGGAGSGSGGGSTAAAEKFEAAKAALIAVGPDNENLVAVDPGDLPSTANMTGYLGLYSSDGSTLYLGTASATADFDAGQLSGGVDDFTEYALSDTCNDPDLSLCQGTPGQSLAGSLGLDGDISGTSFDYYGDGTVTGTFNGEAGTVYVDYGGSGDIGTLNGSLIMSGGGDSYVEVDINGNVDDFFMENSLYLEN